jgi:hypothetical protein
MSSRQIQVALVSLVIAVAAMGMYAYKLLQREEHTARVEARPIPAPVNGNREHTVLMLASDKKAGLRRQEINADLPSDPGQRAHELIHLLMASYSEASSEHRLGSNADVKEVFIVNHKLAVVDMNAAFADTHPSGALAEQLTIDSIRRTLAENVPGITQVKFLVEGKERSTLAGHIDLSEPFPVR